MYRIVYLAQQLVDPSSLPKANADPTTLGDILSLLFKIIGAVAFLMLVISGFRFVISQGEPQKMAEIRRQIIYIVIGLILAATANVIVTFVLNRTA